MNYSRKVIFSIFAIVLLGSASLAYALEYEFSFKITDADGAGGAFDTLFDVAVNSTHIFVVDLGNDRVQIFDSSGNFADSFGTEGNGDGEFNFPTGIAVNSTHIFVSDNGEDRVQIFDLSGNFADTFGSTGANDGEFNTAADIAVNSTHILVSDLSNDNVQIFDLSGNFADTFDTADPRGIDFDSNDNIIVAEQTNDRVQIFDSSGNFVLTFGTTGNGNGQFNSPRGLAVDSNDRIIVSDGNNNDVQVFNVITATATTPSGGSGDQAHKTRPTFGLDHNTFQQLIEGGFSFNGVSHDITHNFWTPFEQQKVKLGESNSFSAKVFAQQELRVQEFLFGIPEIGEANKAELGVEIFYNYDGTVEKVQVIQKTDIIDVDSVKVIKFLSKCLSYETYEKCVTTLLSMKFLEPLRHSVMAIKAIDFLGRTQITYLNDGFDISGDSLNPMNTKFIPGTVKYEGLVEITQTAKYSDIWVAKDGREFETNEYDSFTQINQSFERHIDTDALKNRNHSEFYRLTEYEINRAQMLLEQLCAHCSDEEFGEINDIFAYEYPKSLSKSDDSKIQAVLLSENLKAKQILDKMFEKMYGNSKLYISTITK